MPVDTTQPSHSFARQAVDPLGATSMAIPQVAIIGRPNVGKSSLYNWLVGRRSAIVDSVAGITRDRMIEVVKHEDQFFELIDTGGIGVNDVDHLNDEIEQQIQRAIDQADLLMMVVDIRQGITPTDRSIARRLLQIKKPVLLVANKADHATLEFEANEFYPLGMGAAVCVSAQNRRNQDLLLNRITAELPPTTGEFESPTETTMRIAIVGRRNVGKSTLINSLSDSDRMIVSDVAGTTRDSVDVRFELDGKSFIAIDTPGLRKRKSVRTDVEFYSLHRAQRSIRRADVVLLFFDAGSRISSVDRQLCSYILAHFKPCILVVNKWDLMAPHMPTQQWAEYLREQFPSLSHAPIAFISAIDGKNVKRLLNHAQMLFKQSRMRVLTPDLNRWLRETIATSPPPLTGRRRGKVFYATQISVQPPTIVLKCNDPDAFPETYRRFLLRILHESLSFGEVPIRLLFDQKRSDSSSSRPTAGATDAPPES